MVAPQYYHSSAFLYSLTCKLGQQQQASNLMASTIENVSHLDANRIPANPLVSVVLVNKTSSYQRALQKSDIAVDISYGNQALPFLEHNDVGSWRKKEISIKFGSQGHNVRSFPFL
jgi:hypothetical protein